MCGVAGVHGCAQVYIHVHGCVRVCMGVCGNVRKCAGVCECVCWMNFQHIFWRLESIHQRNLIRILYKFFLLLCSIFIFSPLCGDIFLLCAMKFKLKYSFFVDLEGFQTNWFLPEVQVAR